MSDEVFSDIANAVMRLRHAFMRHGLTPPSSIELATHKDGDKLRYLLPREMVIAQPRMDKNDPQWCFDLVGIEFRYPGQWRHTSRGGKDLV